MKFPASALRHKKPAPAHLRPKEVAPIVVTAPTPGAAAALPPTPPCLPERVAAPRRRRRLGAESQRRCRKSSVASTPAQSPSAANDARKRAAALFRWRNKLLGNDQIRSTASSPRSAPREASQAAADQARARPRTRRGAPA